MIATRLNGEVLSAVKKQPFGAKAPVVKFYQGTAFDELKSLVKTLCPHGKVAFITTLKSNLSFCTKIAKTLKSVNASLCTFVLEDSALSTKNLSQLFSMPDDVRLVLTMDVELVGHAVYFANLKSLPVVVIPSSLTLKGVLDNVLYVRTDEKVDRVQVKVDRHVVIDKEMMGDDLYKPFAYSMSKLVSLIDYRISRTLLSLAPVKKAFDMVKNSVLSTQNVTKLDRESQKDVLIYNAFEIEIASMLSKGEITCFSAENVALDIEGERYNDTLALYLALKIIKIYDLAFSCDLNFTALTNVNAISTDLQEKTGIRDEYYLKNILLQVKSIDKKGDEIKALLTSLVPEIKSFIKFSKKIEETFVSLGGVMDDVDTSFSLSHAGDNFVGANGMTLLREAGLIKSL